MSYALVGSAGAVASGATTAAPSFGQATTAGNLLIAWVYSNLSTSAAPTCSDGTWTAIGVVKQLWYKANCGAGETAPTFSVTASTVCNARLAEFSGGATSSPLDQSGASGSSATSPNIAQVSGTADTALGELIVTANIWLLSKAGTCITSDTYNNGATPTGSASNDATSIIGHYRFAHGITTGNASLDNNTMTCDSMNITTGTGTIASFLLAAASAPTLIQQPANLTNLGLMAKARELAGTWGKRSRSGILVPDLWLPAPV